METTNVERYEVKTARSGEKIPVINGVHLHSSYHPTKEAKVFVETHVATFQHKNEVLVLGLGFAYHVNEIASILRDIHGDNFHIVVIEPNATTFKTCVSEGLVDLHNVTVYTGTNANSYYAQRVLTDFLLKRPTVIAHPASFNLYQDFFKSFLSYEAPKTLSKMKDHICFAEIQDYLAEFAPEATLDQVTEAVFNKNYKLKELDFLLLALKEMTSKSAKENV